MDDDAVGPPETDDVLGAGWVARTLPLRPDALSRRGAPDPVATLVHRRPDPVADPADDLDPPRPRTAVLYLHGFVDYFFHPHVADALAQDGYDLWALDLRDYGRSIRPGRPANEITDLAAYTEEIDTAVRLLRATHERVVLLAHSTGGLTAALWADARRGLGLVDALVLNSPWLELRGNLFERTVLTRTLDVVGAVAPRLVVSHTARHYGEALHAASGGEWDYDLAWKPHRFAARAGFARTVRRAHARVARGLAVDCPVLVLASDAAGPDDRWHDALLTTDSVLDPAQIAARAPLLGPDVTFVQVPGGAHDLALSPAPARERYLDEVRRFLAARLGPDASGTAG